VYFVFSLESKQIWCVFPIRNSSSHRTQWWLWLASYLITLELDNWYLYIEAVCLWREDSLSPPAHSTMIEQLTVQQDYFRSRMDPHYLPPLPPKPKVVFGWHGTSRTYSWVSLACCPRWGLEVMRALLFFSFHAPSAFSSPPKSFIYHLMWRIGTDKMRQ